MVSDEHSTYNILRLLGDTLYGKENAEISTADVIAAKPFIALYFSGSWCPPCRRFTPKLVQFYENLKDQLEIVLISSERSEEAHDAYFTKMPWLQLPYKLRDRNNELSTLFNVEGVPDLVLLRSDGSGIQVKDLRPIIEKDTTGFHFPYFPKTIQTALAESTLSGSVYHNAINGKTLAIFFDGPSFPPRIWGKCHKCLNDSSIGDYFLCEQCPTSFYVCENCISNVRETHDKTHIFKVNVAPDLVAESLVVREALQRAYHSPAAIEAGLDFEVLMVSWAKTHEEYDSHISQFPDYVKLEFDEHFTTAFHLSNLYDVSFDTTRVVILSPERDLINKDAALALKQNMPFPFNSLKIVDLCQSTISNNFDLFEKPSLVVIAAPFNAEHAAIVDAAVSIAAEKFSPVGAYIVCTDKSCELAMDMVEPDIIFFTAKGEDEEGLVPWFRNSAGRKGNIIAPEAIIFDWNDKHATYALDDEVNSESLCDFVEDFKSGRLKALKTKRKDDDDVDKATSELNTEREKVEDSKISNLDITGEKTMITLTANLTML
ncbi:hypothetical protein HK100_012147 [Physocladia obscura]|uniref:Thioredoxin domain-containing protein n=1 Tax=Physocladia obscura TaxID=109957 RepID=A0AAD5T2S3_9FUNG|nr:hypothetical protein HK100_012147 [Physocladia obscura]